MGIMDLSSSLHQTLQNDQTIFPNFSSQRSLQSVPSLTHSSAAAAAAAAEGDNHRLLHSFTPHSSPISSIALSGRHLLFTGSSAHEIASWNSSTAQISNNFSFAAGHGAVKWLAVAGTRLFSAHQDHKIRVWRIHDCDNTNNHYNNDENKNSNNKTFSHARRVATLPTLGDRAAKLLTPGSRVAVRRHVTSTWVHHVDTVSALALSPDGSLLYSVSWDRALKVWRTADFWCLASVGDAHDDAINTVAASPDGHVYTGSADKKIKMWKVTTEKKTKKNNSSSSSTSSTGTGGPTSASTGSVTIVLVGTLEKHNSGVNALTVAGDGAVMYSGAGDRAVVVWERVKDGEGNHWMAVLGALRGHSKAILCLAVVKDMVCSGSADKTVRVWRGVERRYSCVAVLRGHAGPVKCLTAVIDRRSFDDDDDDDDDDGDEGSCLVYSGGLDCEVKVWKIIVPNSL